MPPTHHGTSSWLGGEEKFSEIYNFTKKSLKQHNFRLREEGEDDDNKPNDTKPPDHQQLHDHTQPEDQQHHARKQYPKRQISKWRKY